MKLVASSEKCVACDLCILACSFHHKKEFNTNISSIEVYTHGKERDIQIIIHREKEGERLACDDCKGEKEPLCIKYCIPKALDIG